MDQLIRQYSPTKSSAVQDNNHLHHDDDGSYEDDNHDGDDNYLDIAVKKQLHHIFDIETNNCCVIPEVRIFILTSQ
jgi:hypothetical protein